MNFRVKVEIPCYDETDNNKYYYHTDAISTIKHALSLDEDLCAQIYQFNKITVEELKDNNVWNNWSDKEGHTLDDYILINGKPMLIE